MEVSVKCIRPGWFRQRGEQVAGMTWLHFGLVKLDMRVQAFLDQCSSFCSQVAWRVARIETTERIR